MAEQAKPRTSVRPLRGIVSIIQELGKVSWPSMVQTLRLTILVLVVSILLGIIFGLVFDNIFGRIITFLVGLN